MSPSQKSLFLNYISQYHPTHKFHIQKLYHKSLIIYYIQNPNQSVTILYTYNLFKQLSNPFTIILTTYKSLNIFLQM